jgi:DNA (cytosine-5)-methyltransferase 1
MLRLIELFAGIGSQTQALKNAGIEHTVVAISEIDKYALQSYALLHGEAYNLGDISNIDPTSAPDCDLITYSFPCQDLSVAGAQLGAEEGSGTRSSLLWECKKLIEAKRPRFLLMENVKNLVGPTHKSNFDKWLAYLASLGYSNYWQILNAVDYNAPQSRERVFCVSILNPAIDFKFPTVQERTIKLKDILELESVIPSNMYMDKPYIPREKAEESANGLIHLGNLEMAANESIKRVYSPEGVCPTITTMTGGHRQPKVLIDGKVRKLTPRECWRAMGFSDNEYAKVEGKLSNTQLYKQAGNTICVHTLEAIFTELFSGRY